MVKVKEDMTGWNMSEHGFPNSRITVLEQAEDYVSPKGLHYARWWCKCNCGNEEKFIVKGLELRNGNTQSCGCIRKEKNKKYNEWLGDIFEDENGKYRIGLTTNTHKEFYIDEEDFDKVKDYCWYEVKNGEYRTIEAWIPKLKSQLKIARLIVGDYFDHADRNPFNNRKYNLRKATFSQNSSNRSLLNRNKTGYIGVCFDSSRNKWKASICINHKNINLGRFINKEDAIIARLKAEKEYYGEFAPQRHLFEQYNIK